MAQSRSAALGSNRCALEVNLWKVANVCFKKCQIVACRLESMNFGLGRVREKPKRRNADIRAEIDDERRLPQTRLQPVLLLVQYFSDNEDIAPAHSERKDAIHDAQTQVHDIVIACTVSQAHVN